MLGSNTYYFYGYPGSAENDSKEQFAFYNRAPFPTVERKVSQRPLVMGLPTLNFFSNTTSFSQSMYDIMQIEPNQVLFPKEVEQYTTLLEKDEKIKAFLLQLFQEKGIQVQQAQPYTDVALADVYSPACRATPWLNDKKNLEEWIPDQYLLKRQEVPFYEFPFVAKLTRSSAGDATMIIKSSQDLQTFQSKFCGFGIPIVYEEFCPGKEIGIEIYRSLSGELQLLGCVESMVDANNSYLGGLVQKNAELESSVMPLLNAIAPKLAELGWSGWGGLDVRKGDDGEWKVIDPNMRITQVMPAAWDLYNNRIVNALLYGGGVMDSKGSLEKITTMTNEGILRLYSFCEYEGKLYLDFGIPFDQSEVLATNKKKLEGIGISFNS